MNISPERKADDQVDIMRMTQPGAVIDRSGRVPGFGRLLLLGIILVAMAGLFVVVKKPLLDQMVFGVLGILAMVGVFFLFSLALGVVHVSARTRGEEFGKSYVDSMAEGTIVTDHDGRILYANRAYADLLGIDSAQDVSTVERVFSSEPEPSEQVYKMSHAVREGKHSQREFRMPHGIGTGKTGGARWYRVKSRPLLLPDQKQALSVWQVTDISDERAAQESAFQDLQHAIDYLDHAPAGFFSADSDGTIVYINATLADWLGIELTQFTPGSLRIQDLVLGESMALLNSVQPEPGSAKTVVVDLDLVKMNGQSLAVRLYHKVPFAGDGAPGATRTLVLNRSAGEGSSEALRAAEVRFTRFFNNTPFAIASVGENGEVIKTNAAFRKLFAEVVSSDQLASGFRITSLANERDRERFDKALGEAAEGRGNIKYVDSTLPDDEDVSIRYHTSAVIDGEEGGDGESAIVYAVDMTDQRALEAQMAQSQKMQAVGQLAGGIAHDFNNVLTAIIGFSDLLLANHRASDPSFPDIMNIKQNANRAASLVRQLLAFSRRQTLRPQVLSLPDVLTDLRMLLERLLGNKAKLSIKHGRDLWPIKADIGQFEQVIVNLCVNARDALPEGGTVDITTFNADAAMIADRFARKELPNADYVIIEVTDNGTGMSEKILKQIFEPFFSTKEVGKGTGLGLSTVYGIVKQSGGFIYVDSVEGEGTTFRLLLPRHIPVEGGDEMGTPVGTDSEGVRDLSGSATILLVEDEDAVRSFGARALQMRGYTVFEADSGIEALDVMEEHGDKIDLVVSDVVMPEMDGPTLLGELRKSHKDLKFIFVSGYAEEAFAKNLPEEEKGKFGFLPKPFSLKQLATTVKEMLDES